MEYIDDRIDRRNGNYYLRQKCYYEEIRKISTKREKKRENKKRIKKRKITKIMFYVLIIVEHFLMIF